MSNLSISELPVLTGTALTAADTLPLADLSASETVQINAKSFVQSGIQFIDDASIPWIKINSATLPADTVTTAVIQDGAVTAVKLAGQSSGVFQATGALPSGVFVGQMGVTDGMVYVWTGSAWVALTAPGSINTITGDATGISLISVSQAGDTVSLDTDLAPTAGARQFLAGPTANGGAVSYREIIGLDMPVATSTTQGAVLVNGGGLTISGSTISIDNTVSSTASGVIYGVVKYNAEGLVTDGRAIESADLPPATINTIGAVMPSSSMTVDATGVIDLTNTIVPGTATKVTVDSKGLITGLLALQASDIPDLSADQITSGSLLPARIGDHTIERKKLADYSISFIQEAAPPINDSSIYVGCLWFQESTAQLRMWNSNAWTSIGFGRLSADNLRFGGTIDASTGDITGVTQAGTTGGLVINSGLPAATDVLGGLYVVVDVAGSGIIATPGITYDCGDWVLCISSSEGWVRINTIGGGSGGFDMLSELLDVSIVNPAEGEILVYGSNGLWDNVATLEGGVY